MCDIFEPHCEACLMIVNKSPYIYVVPTYLSPCNVPFDENLYNILYIGIYGVLQYYNMIGITCTFCATDS